MDRHQLRQALQAAGIPAALYEIAGCPGGPWPADRLYLEYLGCLEQQQGQWAVGVQERGVRRVLERFPEEDQACRSLYALLTDPGPPPSPLTPGETRELLHDSDGIQRRARERLARARRAARRPPPGEAGT